MNNRVNILLFRDGVRDVLDSDAYVFIAVEGGDKIYYFEMGSHKLGTRCWDFSLGESFYGDEIHSFSAWLFGVVDEIDANSPLDTIFLYFMVFSLDTMWV